MKEVLKDSLYFSRNHKGVIASLLAPYLLLMFLISAGVQFFSESSPGLIWFEVLVFIVIQPLYIGRLIKYVDGTVNNIDRPIDISLQEWWHLFLVYLLYSLAVMVGIALFIVPGIYFAVRLGFAEFNTVLEGKLPSESLRQSWVDTQPYFWQLMGAGLLFGGGSLIVSMLITGLFGDSFAGQLLEQAASLLISTLLTVLMTVFFFRVYDGMMSERRASL